MSSPARNVENTELHNPDREVEVDFEKFFLIGEPTKVEPAFKVRLTKHTYLPKVTDPRSDWVASVAVPAFEAHRDTAPRPVRNFATIGTGAGLDVVAALEIFNLAGVAITDLHPDVVDVAAENIVKAAGSRRDLQGPVQNMLAKDGDVLEPLAACHDTFDLIYENLPNIPMSTTSSIAEGQISSTYVPERKEDLPDLANKTLTALHWLALTQAKPLLAPGGSVLSSVGARLPLRDILAFAHDAGYRPDILTYTWKIQSEPQEVIGGYAGYQKEGRGPFFFYPAEVPERVFASRSPVEAGSAAYQIEEQLAPYRLDSVAALEAHEKGAVIGHTVVVVRSTLHTGILSGRANGYANAS